MIQKNKLFGSKKARWTLISILFIVPLGLYCKFYEGQSSIWVHNSLGGLLYVIFWCLLVFLFLRSTKPWKIAVGVLVITCLLEFLQLWHPPLLQSLRSNIIGRSVLGTTFAWLDFPYYLVGGGIGWVWMTFLQKQLK